MSNTITVPAPITLSFYEDELVMIEHNGEPHVAMKPIVEAIGLDWKSQHRKLTNDPRWNYRPMTTVGADMKLREMGCIPLRKIAMWLASINASRVKPELRSKLELYQEECDEVLFRHFMGAKANLEQMTDWLEESHRHILSLDPRFPKLNLYLEHGIGVTVSAKLCRMTPATAEVAIAQMYLCGILRGEQAWICAREVFGPTLALPAPELAHG